MTSKRLFALLASILAGTTLAAGEARAEQWLTSKPLTVRFGIEQDWPTSIRVDDAHTDLDFEYAGNGAFEHLLHPDGEELSPDQAHLYANASTRYNLSTVTPFLANNLGVQPGQNFWVLQQNQFAGQLYLGMASHHSATGEMLAWNPGDARGGANATRQWFQVQLVGVRAPTSAGKLAMWQSTVNGQTLYYSSLVNGIDATDAFHLTPGGHVHFNWGFTEAGLWELDFQVRTLTSLDWLEGDANHDQRVNFDDLLVLARNYGKPLGGWWDTGDFNGDFAVDFDDLLLLASNYGLGAPAAMAAAERLSIAVPEPMSAVTFAALGLVAARRSRPSRKGATATTQAAAHAA